MQCFATATAIGREMSYPQVFPRLSSILNLPSLGRTLVILCYWVIVAYMMTSSAIINDAYYWERIGFRNAWISVTQVPLVYMLASKSSIVGLIIGSSHERINWLHRWVSRTLLVTVTVHGYFFMAEWIRADFVKLELEMMPMVIYGIGAWAVLVWTLLTSISPLRRLAYEFFCLAAYCRSSGVSVANLGTRTSLRPVQCLVCNRRCIIRLGSSRLITGIQKLPNPQQIVLQWYSNNWSSS